MLTIEPPTKYWSDQDYERCGFLGADVAAIPEGIGAIVLSVALQTPGGLIPWRCLSGNDNDSYQNRALDVRACATAWLNNAAERRDLDIAMRQAGASSWGWLCRRATTNGGLLATQAAIRRDLAALRGEWPTLSAAVMDTIDDADADD